MSITIDITAILIYSKYGKTFVQYNESCQKIILKLRVAKNTKRTNLNFYLRSCKKEEIHSFLQQYSYNLDCFEKAVLSQAWKIFPKTLVYVYPGLNALRGNIF